MMYYGLLSGVTAPFVGQMQPVEAGSPEEAMRAVRKIWGQQCEILALDQPGAPEEIIQRDAVITWIPRGGPDMEAAFGGLCRIGCGGDSFTLASGRIWQDWIRLNKSRPKVKAQWFAREETR